MIYRMIRFLYANLSQVDSKSPLISFLLKMLERNIDGLFHASQYIQYFYSFSQNRSYKI